jgi:hypothetical protein
VGSVQLVYHHVVIKIRQILFTTSRLSDINPLGMKLVLATANAPGTNGFTCINVHNRGNLFLSHRISDTGNVLSNLKNFKYGRCKYLGGNNNVFITCHVYFPDFLLKQIKGLKNILKCTSDRLVL